MAWFKVDDKLHSHPKVLGVPLRAMGLWVKAGSWCADQLTDGHIPRAVLAPLNATTADARALVAAGLWLEADGGWQFRDWVDYQPTKDQVEKRRAEDAQRKAEARAARAAAKAADQQSVEGKQ